MRPVDGIKRAEVRLYASGGRVVVFDATEVRLSSMDVPADFSCKLVTAISHVDEDENCMEQMTEKMEERRRWKN